MILFSFIIIIFVIVGDAMLSRHMGIDIRQLQLNGHIAATHSGEVSRLEEGAL